MRIALKRQNVTMIYLRRVLLGARLAAEQVRGREDEISLLPVEITSHSSLVQLAWFIEDLIASSSGTNLDGRCK